MSANVEWEIPFKIQSDYADLKLNDETNPLGLFLLAEAGCSMSRNLRVESDDIPQADGQIHHRRFTGGYYVRLAIQLWQSRDKPACDRQLREMSEALMLRVNNMLNNPGRVAWTPTGLGDNRMLDQARVFESGPPVRTDAGAMQYMIAWDSPFPYVIDATEKQFNLIDGSPQGVTNTGDVEVFPVFRVDGPTSSFTISNLTTGEDLVYNAGLPGAHAIGGGDYIEFDFFRNTAYLNGNSSNRKSGIDLEMSDFWSIDPGGGNVFVLVDGANALLLYNNALA